MNRQVKYRQAVAGDVKDIAKIYYGLDSRDNSLDTWKARILDKDTWSIVAIEDEKIVGFIISFTGPDADGNKPEPQKRIRILKTLPTKEAFLSPLLEKGINIAKKLNIDYLEVWIFESEPQIKRDIFLNHGFTPTGQTRKVNGELKHHYCKKL